MHPAYQAKDLFGSKGSHTLPRSDLIRNSVAILALAFAAWAGLAPAMDIDFQNVAKASGLDYTGPSWGVSWGDYDRDGHPDLFLSNHDNASSIFRNLGSTGFVDVTNTVQGDLSGDVHAGAWADMDSDGDGDLLIAVGASGGFGTGSNQLLINSNGAFLESAEALGVDLPPGRGRTPLWLDWNGDRLLDAIIANIPRTDGQAPTTIFTQTGTVFVDDSANLGFDSERDNTFSQLIYVSDYEKPLIIVQSKWPFPDRVFDTGTIPFSNVQQALGLPTVTAVSDVAAGDFDGDLETELYLARDFGGSTAVQTGSNEIRAQLYGSANTVMGFRFDTQGTLDVVFGTPWNVFVSTLFIGSSGFHPSSLSFTLDPADPSTWGEPTLPLGTSGIKVFLDTAMQRWRILVDGAWRPEILISASDVISNLETDGFVSDIGAESDYLLDRIAGAYQNVGTASDVGISRSCGSVVAGDFDNDMDLDIYLVCKDDAHNLPNVLLENDGTGRFTEVLDAAGAVGSTQGLGNTAAVADYNSDGFLDILVTNGHGGPTLNFDGPTELFRNMGNTNHWLGIDLVGVSSNADGIGAVVFVDSGGTRQVRFQGGGMHFGSQDHRRLHFGLAGNTVIDQILIKWPSGLQQTLTDVSADQVLKITEGVVPNKEPTIMAISNQTIDEDSSTGALAFIVNDAETDPAALTLAASSSDQALIPDANLELGGTGTDRTIKAIPEADRSGGPVAITVTVSDGEDVTSSTFLVMVSPANDSPVAQDDFQSVQEDASVNINVTENDSDVDDNLDLTSINIITGPMNGDVTVRANGTIDYTETAVGATSDMLTYTISDASGAASNVATVDISITPTSSGGSLTEEEALALGLDSNDPDGDTDNDGVSDYVEVGGDPGNPLDRDGDGIIDALEPGTDAADAGIVSGLALVSGDAVTISTAAGESLSQISITAATSAPDGVEFPFGAISYTTSSPPGGSVTVRLAFTVDLPENLIIYKVDSAGIYTELPTTVWMRVGSRMMDITLTDGDPMTDLDGVVNGLIDDPIALGSVVPAATSGSAGPDGGGGGCVVNSAAGKDPVLPLIFLASLILLSRRAHRV